MNISRLTTFCRVFELASFSHAAEKLYLSQPTVSSHILVLENELGQKLFDRMGRLIVPTQAGKLLYSHARSVIRQLDQALEEINELRDKVAGELVIGASTIPGHYILPTVLRRYNLVYPDVSLQLRIRDSDMIEKLVESGEVDLGIVGSQSKDPYLDCQPLVRDNLIILGKDDFFRDKSKTAISAQEIEAMPWILREQGSGTRKALERGLQDFGLCLDHLPIAAIVDSTLGVLKCIQAGLGVSLTSRWAADEILSNEEGITAKNPGWSFERSFYILRHKQRSISRASSCFFREVRQELGFTLNGQQMATEGACHE